MVAVCCCAVLLFGELACRLAAIVACQRRKEVRKSGDDEGKRSESSGNKSEVQNVIKTPSKNREALLWSKEKYIHYAIISPYHIC